MFFCKLQLKKSNVLSDALFLKKKVDSIRSVDLSYHFNMKLRLPKCKHNLFISGPSGLISKVQAVRK